MGTTTTPRVRAAAQITRPNPQPVTRVRGCNDPIARQRGLWELVIGEKRWFGPDTIWACLEAQRILEPLAQEGSRS